MQSSSTEFWWIFRNQLGIEKKVYEENVKMG